MAATALRAHDGGELEVAVAITDAAPAHASEAPRAMADTQLF